MLVSAKIFTGSFVNCGDTSVISSERVSQLLVCRCRCRAVPDPVSQHVAIMRPDMLSFSFVMADLSHSGPQSAVFMLFSTISITRKG